ncbi:hypothetical protein [Zoogloea sp.]|uniref:hypothetical protein n=1 Tax=Zoogloea sp. TaxID=49181 RepID=UPI0026278063|nr:hypothetical protein [Zoogloea sp.]MDD3354186.1 hypothetical protein [Zoogloea sp.]
MMELKGRNATWLELAAAAVSSQGTPRVRIHPLSGGGRDGCLALSVDERWLCANDGRLTVFSSRTSAERFLRLLHVAELEEGGKAELAVDCGCHGVQCLGLGNRGLKPCPCPPPPHARAPGASSGRDVMR